MERKVLSIDMFWISIDRSSLKGEARRVLAIEELGDQCKVVFKYGLSCTCEGETPRRRITVTSSLNEMSTDQLGDRMVMRGARGYFALPTPFYSRGGIQREAWYLMLELTIISCMHLM